MLVRFVEFQNGKISKSLFMSIMSTEIPPMTDLRMFVSFVQIVIAKRHFLARQIKEEVEQRKACL